MKRSPLKRKTPMKSSGFSKGLTGVLSIASRQISNRKKPAKPRFKKTVFRSAPYLAAVRTLPCVCCGAVGRTEAAHSNQGMFGKGMGLKSSDATAMALCRAEFGLRGCHATHDQGGTMSKLAWQGFEYLHICKTIIALIRKGRLTGTPTVLASIPFVMHDVEAIAFRLVDMIETGELEVVR